MMRLARPRPVTLLPLGFAVLAAAGIGAVGVLGLGHAGEMARRHAVAELATSAETARRDVSAWLGLARDRVAAGAADPLLSDALARLGRAESRADTAAAGSLPVPPPADLTDAAPLAANRLGSAAGGGFGDDPIALLDLRLRALSQDGILADPLLATPDGTIVYSLGPNAEPGASLRVGPLAGSRMADAFRLAPSVPAGEAVLTDTSMDAPGDGTPVAYLAAPVAGAEGRLAGILIARLPLDGLAKILDAVPDLGQADDLYLVAGDGLSRGASRTEGGFGPLAPLPPLPQVAAAVAGREEVLQHTTALSGDPAIAVVRPFGPDDLAWSIVAERDSSAVAAAVAPLRRDLMMFGSAAALLLAGLGWLLGRRIAAPLAALASSAVAVSQKRYDAAIPGLDRIDELGQLACVIAGIRDQLQRADLLAAEREAARSEQDRMVSELGAALSRLAEGDLTRSVDVAFGADHERLREDVNLTMSELSSILSLVVESAGQISRKAHEISSASDDLSRRTENQAATLEETAAALDELTASVKSSAQGAAEVDEVVDKARSEAEQSGVVVRDAVAAMAEIERSSDEISQIISVIDDIAFQTNLLALNAGVEAARAGEAGKGFAVVASEVRTLAQRSSDAAKQIKVLISGSAQHVRQGVDLVGRAGEALTSIVERVAHISELVSDIATGAREQATGLSEINGGVNQLDQVTQQNAAMVEESTAASHALTDDAKRLAEVVARFRLRAPGSSGAAQAVRLRHAAPTRPTSSSPGPPLLEATTGQPVSEGAWVDF